MTREVLYERNVTGSYMKVPMAMEGKLDEKIMLRKKLPGLLSVEKIFVNQGAWYWYDISGHQSLDHYCRVKPLQEELLENIITSICFFKSTNNDYVLSRKLTKRRMVYGWWF